MVVEGMERKSTLPKGPKPYDPGPEIDAFIIEGIDTWKVSFRAMGELLEEKEVPTAHGGKRWHATTVRRQYQLALLRREETALKENTQADA